MEFPLVLDLWASFQCLKMRSKYVLYEHLGLGAELFLLLENSAFSVSHMGS